MPKPKAEQEPPVVEPWMEEVARRMAEGIKARQAGRRWWTTRPPSAVA